MSNIDPWNSDSWAQAFSTKIPTKPAETPAAQPAASQEQKPNFDMGAFVEALKPAIATAVDTTLIDRAKTLSDSQAKANQELENIRKQIAEDPILKQRPDIVDEVWQSTQGLGTNLSPATRFERTKPLMEKAVNLAQQANPYAGSVSYSAPQSGYGMPQQAQGKWSIDNDAVSLPTLEENYAKKNEIYEGLKAQAAAVRGVQ